MTSPLFGAFNKLLIFEHFGVLSILIPIYSLSNLSNTAHKYPNIYTLHECEKFMRSLEFGNKHISVHIRTNSSNDNRSGNNAPNINGGPQKTSHWLNGFDEPDYNKTNAKSF